MTLQRIKDLMEIELSCIEKAEAGCNRDCGNCDLVQKTDELKTAHSMVIKLLRFLETLTDGNM